MKFITTIVVSLFFITTLTSQSVTNYQAQTASVRFKNEDGTWKKWSDKIKVNIKFKIDFSKNMIYFYSDSKDEFRIISREKNNPEKNDIVLWCLNAVNERYIFIIRLLKENKLVFFIQHKNYEFRYDILT